MCRWKYFIVSVVFLKLCFSYKVSVEVEEGTLIGTKEATTFTRKQYYAFYRVPYATSPVKNLRFKDPKPVGKWKKPVQASTVYHGACAQAHIVHKHAVYGSEDCLYLNVFTPKIPKQVDELLKPIIVWLHGYAFTSSFSHIFGIDFLIENDVIVSSLNHRIGVFGFLKVNETDSHANMGLKDIVMALKWIRRNAKSFGGDKKRITVMGSSSAATFLSILLMTKEKRLFSKMILHSGAIFSPSIFMSNPKLESLRLRTELGKMSSKNLTNASTKEIIMASMKIYTNKEMINFQRPVIPFSPCIEEKSNNSLILMRPSEFYKDLKNVTINKSILIGFNSQESISEVIPFIHNPRLLNSFTAFFKFMVPFNEGCRFNYSSEAYGRVAQKIKKEYFKSGITEKSLVEFLKLISDVRKFPIYKFIKTNLKTNTRKMFVYNFNYVGKFNLVKLNSIGNTNVKIKGAASGDELCYLLKCLPMVENYIRLINNNTDYDRQFMVDISEMWSNFAKTGNPSKPGAIISWPPMKSDEGNILLIGRESRIIRSTLEERMFLFWNGIYDDFFSYKHCNKSLNHDEL